MKTVVGFFEGNKYRDLQFVIDNPGIYVKRDTAAGTYYVSLPDGGGILEVTRAAVRVLNVSDYEEWQYLKSDVEININFKQV